ncbi:MAG: DUF4956 domain-containing protein [Verrucomicrobiota bacterium]
MEALFNAMGPARAFGLGEVFTSLCLSFVMGMLIAKVYRWTHGGFSYSRSFLQTLVLGSIVATIMIVAIGNNMARGLGILGALALIRFRTPLRDPRDIIFVFASLATGISCGAQVFTIAILGPVFFCVVAVFLTFSPFTSRRTFEGLLRFIVVDGHDVDLTIQQLFATHAAHVELVALREALQAEAREYSYQVRLLEPSGKAELVTALEQVEGIEDVSMIMQRSTVEI